MKSWLECGRKCWKSGDLRYDIEADLTRVGKIRPENRQFSWKRASARDRDAGTPRFWNIMSNLSMSRNAFLAIVLMFSLLAAALPSPAQDVAVISDITGGSSVFIFRGSQKSATRKFTTQERSGRSKSQRIAVGKKITRQYVTLAKVAPRRARTEAVNPEDPRIPKIATMPKEQASKLFAGVGEYYIDKENPEEASNFFREAFSLDAKNSIAKNGLSEALALRGNDMLAKDKPDDAKKFFDESLTFNPNNAVAYFGLGEMYSGIDDDAKAIASYEKALSLDKALTEIYVPLGILYYQGGEIAKADNLLTKAITVTPEDAETQYFLGLVRYAQNNNDAALRGIPEGEDARPELRGSLFLHRPNAGTPTKNGRRRHRISTGHRAQTELLRSKFRARVSVFRA